MIKLCRFLSFRKGNKVYFFELKSIVTNPRSIQPSKEASVP